MNLGFVGENGSLFLRINVGDREWIRVPAFPPRHVEEVVSGEGPYSVRTLRRDGEYKLRAGFKENRDLVIGFEKGAVGVDFNHGAMDLAVTNEKSSSKIPKRSSAAPSAPPTREARVVNW